MRILHSPAGYTLIESLVLLVVVGILSSLSIPSLTPYIERARVRGTLDRLSGELYQARVLAVRAGTRVHIRFVPGSGCAEAYELIRLDTGALVHRVTVADEANGVCLSSNVPRSFSIDSRGLLLGSARTVFASAGGERDSLIISMVGRVLRSK
jgi:type II secretory pathway pseudopilin PulG